MIDLAFFGLSTITSEWPRAADRRTPRRGSLLRRGPWPRPSAWTGGGALWRPWASAGLPFSVAVVLADFRATVSSYPILCHRHRFGRSSRTRSRDAAPGGPVCGCPGGRILIHYGLGRPSSDPASFIIARVSGRVKGGRPGRPPRRPVFEHSRNPMPFAVFRRHQRKLLAIFAILAMFGFVLVRLACRDCSTRALADGDQNRSSSSCTASRSTGASSTRWPASGTGPTGSWPGCCRYMPASSSAA